MNGVRVSVSSSAPPFTLTSPDAPGVVSLRGKPHRALVERAGQAIEHHGVDDLLVADAVTGASAGQEVGGVGHGLHAARNDDVGFAGADHEIRQVDGLEPREAHLVDRRGVNRHRHAALHCGLARGDLALSRENDLTHEYRVDRRGVHSGLLQHAADGGATQVLRAQ